MGATGLVTGWALHRRIRRAIDSALGDSRRALRVKDNSVVICDIMVLSQDENLLCRPKSTAGKLDLFHIPAPDDMNDQAETFFSMKAVTYGLNSLTGLKVGHNGIANPMASRVQKRLRSIVESSCILEEPIPTLNFKDFSNSFH